MLAIPDNGTAVGIARSKHNLSASGRGSIKASSETEICIFCHTPHSASLDAPLWNRESSGTTYVPYSSSTAKASYRQPTGASKVCLSCHDGTVALGAVKSRAKKIRFDSGVEGLPSGKANLGTDLGDDHPVSFVYDMELTKRTKHQLADPASIKGGVHVDKDNQMQCTSCHDPHDDRNGMFLVEENKGSKLCVMCHKISFWENSAHSTSIAGWNGREPNPWPHTDFLTVADNGCENCHTPHRAAGRSRLMIRAREEDNCYSCHNGNVSKNDITADFNKLSTHPIRVNGGVHDPVENLKNSRRHATCVDCHNPHATRVAAASQPPDAPGSIAGVRGITADGSVTEAVTREYELCFRCHSDSANRGPARVPRQSVQTNTRLEFSPSNPSYHPVLAMGKNGNVPSLIAPYKTTTMIYCGDCHNNDQGTKEGGKGANGPHGSSYAPILSRQLITTDSMPESAAAYALCYKCHSRDSLLRNESFAQHSSHIAIAACTTCHDSHGSADSLHLINFNRDYVSPYQGTIAYTSEGGSRNSCTLTCHGKDHGPETFGVSAADPSGSVNDKASKKRGRVMH